MSLFDIRNIIKNGSFDITKRLLPPPSFEILIDNIKQGHIVSNIIDTGYAIAYADSV